MLARIRATGNVILIRSNVIGGAQWVRSECQTNHNTNCSHLGIVASNRHSSCVRGTHALLVIVPSQQHGCVGVYHQTHLQCISYSCVP